MRSLVRRRDSTLLLRKRQWNDCHRQFGVLWSYDNRLFLPAIVVEYVVSTTQCHMPHNLRDYGFIARDISWPRNFSCQNQLVIKTMRFILNLKTNIRQVMAEMPHNMCQKVVENDLKRINTCTCTCTLCVEVI